MSHLNTHELDSAANASDERSPLSRRSSVEDLSYGQCVEAPNHTTSLQGVTAGPVVSPGSHQDATQAMGNTQDAGSSFTHNTIPPQEQENAENAQENRVPPQQQEKPRRQGRNNGRVIQFVQHSNGIGNTSRRGQHIVVSTDSGGSTTISMGGGLSTGPTFIAQFNHSVSNNGVHTFSSHNVHSRPRGNVGSSIQLGLPPRPRLPIGPRTAAHTTTMPTLGSGNLPSSSSANTSAAHSDGPDFTVSTEPADVNAAAESIFGSNCHIPGGAKSINIIRPGTYVQNEVTVLRRVGD